METLIYFWNDSFIRKFSLAICIAPSNIHNYIHPPLIPPPGHRVDRAASRAGVQPGARDRGDERGAARGGQARHLRRGEAAGAAAARPPLRQIRGRKRESNTRPS